MIINEMTTGSYVILNCDVMKLFLFVAIHKNGLHTATIIASWWLLKHYGSDHNVVNIALAESICSRLLLNCKQLGIRYHMYTAYRQVCIIMYISVRIVRCMVLISKRFSFKKFYVSILKSGNVY